MEYLYINIDNEEATINKNIFPLKFILLCFIYLILSISIRSTNNATNSLVFQNEFKFEEYLFPSNKFKTGENHTYFNITQIDYKFSYEFNIVQVEYYIGFYDQNDKLLIPSDIAF